MRIRKAISLALALATLLTATPAPVRAKVNYQQEMTDLMFDMHSYAKRKKGDFKVVSNGGYGLYNADMNGSAARRQKFLNSVEGVLIENVFYGYNCKMNNVTPAGEKKDMRKALDTAIRAKENTFNIEYCSGRNAGQNSYRGSVYYNAPSVRLDQIPPLAKNRVNNSNVTRLKDVKNFCALLDPYAWERKNDRKGYLKAIKNSNYDLIFIDLFFNKSPLTRAEVNSLKTKKNGKKRLVCSYISVGEAEKGRYYWSSSWNNVNSRPNWICRANSSWRDNFKVRYWNNNWQRTLYGNNGAYLDRIINAGFDGAYFDVIDAYEYFEDDGK